MPKIERTRINQVTIVMLTIGAALVALSVLNASSFLAIFGVSIAFWSAILLYITPTKHVPLTLLNASTDANASNIERLLIEHNLAEKGVYLPPKNLENLESSLVFVPNTPKTTLPTPEETSEKLFSEQKTGLFLTPLGFSLSRLFEQELGTSFTKIDLPHMQRTISKLLVQDMEIAENAQIQIQDRTITVEITGSIFNTLCQETNSQPRTHEQVGCLLASAIACALAKATGKPITIQKETQDPETKITQIKYRMEEE
jgi:hypothetical protein